MPEAGLSPSDAVLRRVRRSLLAWYAAEHRDFPWRRTSDPYAVLVSEVMLQQTQAARVVERFPRFMARFPSVEALARASDAEVLVEWSGLGYNRRAIALRNVARRVTAEGWPSEVSALERLPGIGRYTARALASLSLREPVGVVDTNVRRWLVRRFGLPLDGGAADATRLQSLADRLARARGSRERESAIASWTHATMEFGARICASRQPRCGACPIAGGCPSRNVAARVAVRRQPAFHGSQRAIRGAILRRLAAAVDHELALSDLAAGDEPAAEEQRALDAMQAEGLVHVRDGLIRLGAADLRGASFATEDPRESVGNVRRG